MAKQKSRFPSYGLVRGPSHKHGGVAGVVAGEQPVELEGGEWIIPKEVVPDYLPALKQITNEGRAMQNMDNGNSAMDALIAQASLQTGFTEPKSPVYQKGGNVTGDQMIAKMFPASRQGIDYAVSDMIDFEHDDIQPTNVIDYARALNLTEEDLQRLTDTPASQALKHILGGREFRIPRVSERISKRSPLGNLYKAQPKMAKTAAGREELTRMYKEDLQDLLGMNPYSGEGNRREAYMKRYAGNKVGRFSKEDRIQLLTDLVGASQRRLPSPTLMEDPRGVTPMDEVLSPLIRRQEQGGPVNYYQKGGQAGLEQISDLSVFGDKSAMDALMAPASLESGLSQPFTAEQYWEMAAALGGTGSEYLGDYLDRMDKKRVNGVIPEYGWEHYSGFDNFKDFKESVESWEKIKKFGETARDKRRERGISPSKQEMMSRAWENNPGGLTIRRPEERYGYQTGGQMQPRKQQEMRSPAVYGPPVEMMGPMPTDTSAVDTTGNALQHMLNQLMMRDVNQNINPFTGDTIDTYLDSLKLQQRMKKSKIPPSAGRKKSRHGGPVMYQEGGMVGQQQAMGPVPQGSLMGVASDDIRIKPLEPDTYITKVGENEAHTMQVPKLKEAYLKTFGVETPLSKQQSMALHRNNISPNVVNPNATDLFTRALVQRLADEPE